EKDISLAVTVDGRQLICALQLVLVSKGALDVEDVHLFGLLDANQYNVFCGQFKVGHMECIHAASLVLGPFVVDIQGSARLAQCDDEQIAALADGVDDVATHAEREELHTAHRARLALVFDVESDGVVPVAKRIIGKMAITKKNHKLTCGRDTWCRQSAP